MTRCVCVCVYTGVEEAGSDEVCVVYTGVEEAGSDEMMNLVQEAHIVSVDVGDDRLGDDEWNLLSNTPSLVFSCYFCLD